MNFTQENKPVTQSRLTPAGGRTLPPVVLLGGESNALAISRLLGRQGVRVYVIAAPDAAVRYSRYCRWLSVPVQGRPEDAWQEFLLGRDAAWLSGAVLLACSDAGIRTIAWSRQKLAARYLLDESDPVAQLDMLDKLSTYRHAQAAGVPTPKFWVAQTRQQIEAARDELVFPLLLKPRLSHVFEQRFGRKHITATSFDQVLAAFDTISDTGIEVMLSEVIPGPDNRLCSYYTYIDEQGACLFDFTKRVIRRYPAGMGTACYHITDWVPEIVPLARKLFAQAGLRGMANVEFKMDDRDGLPKLIECNARFTVPTGFVAASGVDLASLVYNRIVGRPAPDLNTIRQGLRLWDPVRDFWSFLELRSRGELTLWQWLASIMHRQTLPYFAWSDPLPALARLCKPLRRCFGRRTQGQRRGAAAAAPAQTVNG
jgi:predicted ATP-grasp superfamily ATP-dependent carboligase